MSEQTIWARISEARKDMRLNKSGRMRIGGNGIQYATIDDLYSTLTRALSKHDLWLLTPLEDGQVLVKVVDVLDGSSVELLRYPCVLSGRDVKEDSGKWTSCKRYALTSAFNLASGDESSAEQSAVKQEERRSIGYARQSRYKGVPESKVTEIRALLVQSGAVDPHEQRAAVERVIHRKVEGRLSDAGLTPAEAQALVEALTLKQTSLDEAAPHE